MQPVRTLVREDYPVFAYVHQSHEGEQSEIFTINRIDILLEPFLKVALSELGLVKAPVEPASHLHVRGQVH